jgi:hypothetical protein
MEDQTNCAFWQSQINFENLSEYVGASTPFAEQFLAKCEGGTPLDSRKPAKNLLLKGTQAPASAGACLGIVAARLFD